MWIYLKNNWVLFILKMSVSRGSLCRRVATIGELIKIQKDAAVACFNLPWKYLFKCSWGTATSIHLRNIQPESGIQDYWKQCDVAKHSIVWFSGLRCYWQCRHVTEIHFSDCLLVICSLVYSCTDSVSLSCPGMSWQMLVPNRSSTTKQGHPVRNRLVPDVVKMHRY